MNTYMETPSQNVGLWENSEKLNDIRKLFASKLTELEFQFFVGLGKATNLNPFTREIWCVKYQDNSPAQVFIGRDGYRKAAQAHSEYDYHQSDAVYENDDFQIHNGEVQHTYKLTNRGKLVGAYCISKRHKSSRPIYVFAELNEYSTGKSLWNPSTGKPATMIKKVAESQCLRACFQDLLGGTYGEEEMSRAIIENSPGRIIEGTTQTEKLKSILNIKKDEKCDNEDIEPSILEMASEAQINEIEFLFHEKGFDSERKKKAFDYFKITTLDDLTDEKARLFLMHLNKL